MKKIIFLLVGFSLVLSSFVYAATYPANSILTSDSSGAFIIATSSSALYISNLVATSTAASTFAGAVGVGTTSPYAKLSVQGTLLQTNPVFEVASSSSAIKFLSVAGNGNGTTTLSGLNISGSATSTSNVGMSITTGCYAIGTTCLSSGSSSVGPVNTLQASDGAGGFIGTGTPRLTVGSLIATTTASSTFAGPISSPSGQLLVGSVGTAIIMNPYYIPETGGSGGVIIGTSSTFSLTGSNTGTDVAGARRSALAVVGKDGGSSNGDKSSDPVAPILFVQGGNGGNSTSGSFAVGGTAQSVNIKTGIGGNATGGSFVNSGGNGGSMYLTTGAGGTGATNNGKYGNISLGQSAGGFIFALNPVGIGSSFGPFTSPVSTLDVLGNISVGTYAASVAAPSNGMIVSGIIGTGTSSPYASLSIQSNSSTGDAFAVATSTGASVAGYDNDGHQFTSGPAPAISSCGTGTGTVVGDDQSGIITTATAATACTATFSKAYRNTPTCTVTDDSLIGFADVSSISTTAVTFGISSALTGGHLYYQCTYHK